MKHNAISEVMALLMKKPNRNVYLVDGLKVNLINISQLCDDELEVIFTKEDYNTIDEKCNLKLKGQRSFNNCYAWKPLNVMVGTSDQSNA